ncbi:HIRA-interacting protein 5 [Nadsonia fulvescens var. elongata DSM 6958]|uniref:HIRA-interacting protein 5 n=1 Tax=Nadsonia fulvescens var. elongata DSM 6958 TaxID=857566 RepID=A0A1E3PGA4_9ASCO|nr:HIRA-interacting protein 5 [Nadsonia fulvescens var. elongata DSM 6958]
MLTRFNFNTASHQKLLRPFSFRSAASSALIRLLHIHTTTTPNPDALKFLPETALYQNTNKTQPHYLSNSTIEFLSRGSAQQSPLAARIFEMSGVKSVLIGPKFVTVEKEPEMSWNELKLEVFEALTAHTESKDPAMKPQNNSSAPPVEEDDELVELIKELIDTRIRPAIQEDGGDVDFIEFDEETGIVSLCLRGACRTCDSSEVTLKHGIESMLMHYVEEVKGVKSVMGPEEAKNMAEFNKLEERLKQKHKDKPF